MREGYSLQLYNGERLRISYINYDTLISQNIICSTENYVCKDYLITL